VMCLCIFNRSIYLILSIITVIQTINHELENPNTLSFFCKTRTLFFVFVFGWFCLLMLPQSRLVAKTTLLEGEKMQTEAEVQKLMVENVSLDKTCQEKLKMVSGAFYQAPCVQWKTTQKIE
jgi:hypothetical protein